MNLVVTTGSRKNLFRDKGLITVLWQEIKCRCYHGHNAEMTEKKLILVWFLFIAQGAHLLGGYL